MKRLALAVSAACFAVGAVPAAASATEIQIGNTTTPLAAPTCTQQATVKLTEADCEIFLTKKTAYETLSDGVANPTEITQPGVIDSFTLAVSGMVIQGATLSSELSLLDTAYGGPASVELTVLRPVASTTGPRWAVAAQSPSIALQPYLGGVVEFPLIAPLPVVRGEVLALTVPTWAPILTSGLSTTQFSYSQSHTQILTGTGTSQTTSCTSTSAPTLAQVTLGEQALYSCNYQGTRLEYTALEVTAPAVSPSVRHHRKHAARARARHAGRL